MTPNYREFKTTVGGKEVVIETGKYTEQANGSCVVRCGETAVLVTVCMSETPREGMDFFPLQVDYEEKMYSVGKIPGGFKRREGRASDKAILTSRLIDRPLRPLFPKGLFNDVVVIATAISVEPDVSPEPLAMIGSSVALSISDIPWAGPTGSVVVGLVDGKYVINPNAEEREKSTIHLNLAGTKDAILMIEAGADEVTNDEMVGAIMFGHKEIAKICEFIEKEIVPAIGKPKKEIELYHVPEELDKEVRAFAEKKIEWAIDTTDRKEREERYDQVEKEALEHFAEKYPDNKREIKDSIYYLNKEKIRAKIFDKGIRPDGRGLKDVRPIWCERHPLPRVHGSAVFTRGQTQTLATCTLDMLAAAQKLEGLDDETAKRYMHQYNFPGYCTGEAKAIRGAGRREIGHGALAERALIPVIPSEEEFPYAIRVVNDILSSNGSSSMASVCGSTMALMDAGVPIKAPVAGVAMGLIKNQETGEFRVMTDIQGLEDFLGDMDLPQSRWTSRLREFPKKSCTPQSNRRTRAESSFSERCSNACPRSRLSFLSMHPALFPLKSTPKRSATSSASRARSSTPLSRRRARKSTSKRTAPSASLPSATTRRRSAQRRLSRVSFTIPRWATDFWERSCAFFPRWARSSSSLPKRTE